MSVFQRRPPSEHLEGSGSKEAGSGSGLVGSSFAAIKVVRWSGASGLGVAGTIWFPFSRWTSFWPSGEGFLSSRARKILSWSCQCDQGFGPFTYIYIYLQIYIYTYIYIYICIYIYDNQYGFTILNPGWWWWWTSGFRYPTFWQTWWPVWPFETHGWAAPKTTPILHPHFGSADCAQFGCAKVSWSSRLQSLGDRPKVRSPWWELVRLVHSKPHLYEWWPKTVV